MVVGVDEAVVHDGIIVSVTAGLITIVGVDAVVVQLGTTVCVFAKANVGMLDAVVTDGMVDSVQASAVADGTLDALVVEGTVTSAQPSPAAGIDEAVVGAIKHGIYGSSDQATIVPIT